MAKSSEFDDKAKKSATSDNMEAFDSQLPYNSRILMVEEQFRRSAEVKFRPTKLSEE